MTISHGPAIRWARSTSTINAACENWFLWKLVHAALTFTLLSPLAQVKYWLHRTRWQSCTEPDLHPRSVRCSQKADAKEERARPRRNGLHICYNGPNIISGHVCLIRRSRLQGKKNASVGTVYFFWGLEALPAGTATGACFCQLTFYVWSHHASPGPQHVWLLSFLVLNSLEKPITYYT